MLRTRRSEAIENFVVQDVDAMLSTQFDKRVVPIKRQDRACWIMRKIYRDQFGIWSNGVRHPVNIEGPIVVRIERYTCRGTYRDRQRFMGFIIWRYNDGVTVFVENHGVGRKDALARSCKTKNVACNTVFMCGRNRLTQIRCAERFCVAKPQALEFVPVLGWCQREQFPY